LSQAIIIGLTGGIGCGKSAVGKALEALGLARLDTDQVAREVVAAGTPGLAEIVSRFGPTILSSDGTLDRAAMGRMVFSEPEKKSSLEQILHPLIRSRVSDFVECCRAEHQHAVVEVPLLYEKQRQDVFDTIWVVSTTPELQLARLRSRNGWSHEEVKARISSQMPLAEKVARADTVIENTGTLEDLQERVREAWSQSLR